MNARKILIGIINSGYWTGGMKDALIEVLQNQGLLEDLECYYERNKDNPLLDSISKDIESMAFYYHAQMHNQI
jgi:hypothetical protein